MRDGSLLAGETGCIHPRKAIVADLNGDARPDLFVACHGYDAEPFPGEPSYTVLSQPGGTYAVEAVGNGFYHGATAADIDRDGVNEISVSRTSGGDGTFYESRTVQRVRWPGLDSDVLLSERSAPAAYFLFPHFEGDIYSLVLVSPDAEGAYRLALP